MSEHEHKSLAEALLAVQSAAPALPKDGRNPHFNSKFTKLDTIRERIGPLLVEHGLTWQTFPCFGPNGEPALRYTLTHVSGDRQSDVMPLMLTKNSAQDLGSAITYARRYSVTAVLDLVADEDDDGNNASRNGNAEAGQSPAPVAQTPKQTERPASAKQRGLMNAKAAEAELAPSDFADAILRATGQDARQFDSQDAAKNWVQRALDRLPARHVDSVLAEIQKATEAVPA